MKSIEIMITFEKAFEIIQENSRITFAEKVSLTDSLNRVCADDIVSDIDMPPFNKSAVDGFACRQEDLTNNLQIIETIAAGDIPKRIIQQNQCSKIMTGAMVPEGANCVIMVEDTETISDNIIHYTTDKTNRNISNKGEDIQSGQVVLKKGTFIQPKQIALLASVGYAEIMVNKKPKVAILSTGNELVEPDQKPGPGQIRNSNAWQLQAQVLKSNALPFYLGIIEDNEVSTDKAIKRALLDYDVIILTGGVSMGEFDFVPKVLKNNQFHLLFEKILTKPGMPTVFGVHKKAFVFGLPGNPVSSFLIFEILVKPFLQKLMGNNNEQPTIKLPLGIDYKRKKTDRLGLIPASVNSAGELIPSEYHGSAHVLSICEADYIFFVPIGISGFKKGEMVNVRQI